MLASTLLVTLRGPLRTIDLELPGDIAVAELMPLLLEICGEEQNDPQALPQAGAHLQVAGTYTPLPLERTLIESGICNGTLLVLLRQGDERKASPNSAIPQQPEPRWVQPGINTGGIGVTWESLV
jgi:WXG100 protein secretion system (Wss), protein YukD